VKHDRHEVSPVVVVVAAASIIISATIVGAVTVDDVIVATTAASVVFGATATTVEVMRLLHRSDSTLARLQRKVAVTTCWEQIFACDVIAMPHLWILFRKQVLAICTNCRADKHRLFGSRQQLIGTSHERMRLIAFASAKM